MPLRYPQEAIQLVDISALECQVYRLLGRTGALTEHRLLTSSHLPL